MTPTYMMATVAIHKLGDISRPTPDLCHVAREDDENYYGVWVAGYGFVDVKFPKATTRPLTDEERAYWKQQWFGTPWGQYQLTDL